MLKWHHSFGRKNFQIQSFTLKSTLRKILAIVILFSSLSLSAPVWAIDFSAHGYYRQRFEFTHDLDLQRPNPGIVGADDDNDRFGTIAFGQQRFRLQPLLKLNDHISIHGEIDFLDNLLFGQSNVQSLEISNPIVGTLELPPANGAFGVVGGDAGANLGSGGGNINVRQMYVDIMTAGGKFRIGRQAFNWGLGVFVNDGEGVEGDFGDVFDRVLYLAGLGLKNGAQINVGIAYDFAFEATRDPSIGGLDSGLGSNWNDVSQAAVILLYRSTNFEIGLLSALRFRDGNDGSTTTTATFIDTGDVDGDGNVDEGVELPAGKDGDTLLFVFDAYGKLHFAKYYTVAVEAVFIGGKIAPGVAIDAIILDDPAQAGLTNPLDEPITLPLDGNQNDIAVFMAAAELTADWDFGGEAKVQAGFASGDSSPLSSKITQLGFRPDYDIALMMFDVPLGTSPSIRVGGIRELGKKPVSSNYINNAIYFTMGYKHEFDITSGVPWAQDFKVGGKVITAFAPSRTIDLDFTEITGVAGLPHVVNDSPWYGFEIDLSVEARFFEFMKWETVIGGLFPGGVYDIKDDFIASNPGGVINSISADGAEPAFAAKTTLFFEF
ncbi:MAG TPA: hypothetical protein DDW49_07795 [Deltaproteobacteria bacterium]|nr:MAG: hypothetical protein A2048_07435 [Deltaproteobacteria bacterium GWA2_45_12]HBF13272.1 hypothetical protein [Deltaproteobacteria bacterium]